MDIIHDGSLVFLSKHPSIGLYFRPNMSLDFPADRLSHIPPEDRDKTLTDAVLHAEAAIKQRGGNTGESMPHPESDVQPPDEPGIRYCEYGCVKVYEHGLVVDAWPEDAVESEIQEIINYVCDAWQLGRT